MIELFPATSQRLRQRALAAFSALALLGSTAAAQIPLSGWLSDDTTGPLLSGVVYHAIGHTMVAAGKTLTVQPGAIVKFSGTYLDVYGTLDVNGSAVAPVVFTSLLDDTAGGDSAGDGPTTGTPGQWWGVYLEAGSDASAIEHAILRFAGLNASAGVEIVGSSARLDHVTIEHGSQSAVDLNDSSCAPVIAHCVFTANAGPALAGVRLDSVPSLLDNSASGNGGDYTLVVRPSPSANLSISAANCLNGVLVFAANCVIPEGLALTLQGGVVIKERYEHFVQVLGTLTTSGSALSPVVFTCFADDEYAGDTNGDGPSAGTPAAWWGIYLDSGASASVLSRALVRYAGANASAGIEIRGSSPSILDTQVERGAAAGIDFNDMPSSASVQGCTLKDNLSTAITGVRIDTLPGIASNAAAGNAGDFTLVTTPSPSVDLTLVPANCLNGALVFAGNCVIAPGRTLTLQAGVVIKQLYSSYFHCLGTLLAQGSAGAPVVFTTFADDAWAGDTNFDGPSAGAPGSWWGLYFEPGSDASALEHAIVRYSGANLRAGIEIDASSPRVRETRVEFGSWAGLDLNGSSCAPQVEFCWFVDNGGTAITGARLDSVSGFLDNFVSGNAGGDFLFVSEPTPLASVEIGPENCPNGTLVFGNHCVVPAGLTLRLRPGVVVKHRYETYVDVNGSLESLGTAIEPVVFTTFADDDFGGDTNGDGWSTGKPASWRGVYFQAGAGAGRMENTLVRFSGALGSAGVQCFSPLVALRAVRAEHGSLDGFLVSAHAGPAVDWVAYDNGRHGIALLGGSIDVLHASAVQNGGLGVQSSGPHAGSIVNSVLWDNALGSFGGAGILSVHYSCTQTPTPGAGNISLDPVFVDPWPDVGDLRLQQGSPCIGAGDFATGLAVVKDWNENSRVLDTDLDGALAADMGAFQYTVWNLQVGGAAKLGSTITFTVVGPVGISAHAFGLMDASLYLPPYGIATVGVLSFMNLGLRPIGQPLTIAIPVDPVLVGRRYGYQCAAIPFSAPQLGNLTNLHRGTLHL